MSARTALEVDGPPAPGPDIVTRPTGLASKSTRFVTPLVAPSGVVALERHRRHRRADAAVGGPLGARDELDRHARAARPRSGADA